MKINLHKLIKILCGLAILFFVVERIINWSITPVPLFLLTFWIILCIPTFMNDSFNQETTTSLSNLLLTVFLSFTILALISFYSVLGYWGKFYSSFVVFILFLLICIKNKCFLKETKTLKEKIILLKVIFLAVFLLLGIVKPELGRFDGNVSIFFLFTIQALKYFIKEE